MKKTFFKLWLEANELSMSDFQKLTKARALKGEGIEIPYHAITQFARGKSITSRHFIGISHHIGVDPNELLMEQNKVRE
jgi:hypothetical protein